MFFITAPEVLIEPTDVLNAKVELKEIDDTSRACRYVAKSQGELSSHLHSFPRSHPDAPTAHSMTGTVECIDVMSTSR